MLHIPTQCFRYCWVGWVKHAPKYLISVLFPIFSFTWSSSHIDRNILLVLTGQHVEMFDVEFRELYAISEEVNLYKELGITNPHLLGTGKPGFHSSTVARKIINPKYGLVAGAARGDMMLWASRHKQDNQGNMEKEETSESKKRLNQFLNDLITLDQELPEIEPPLENLNKLNRSPQKLFSRLHMDLKNKSKSRESIRDVKKEDAQANSKQGKRFSSGLFSRRAKRSPGSSIEANSFASEGHSGEDLGNMKLEYEQLSISHASVQSADGISGKTSPTIAFCLCALRLSLVPSVVDWCTRIQRRHLQVDRAISSAVK